MLFSIFCILVMYWCESKSFLLILKRFSSLYLQLQTAYQDKEDENQRLKHYIDTILLNIVENYPQLLEVKALDSGKQ